MPKPVTEVTRDAAEPSPPERLKVARVLFDLSEHIEEPLADVENAWDKEIERPLEELRSGSVKARPIADVNKGSRPASAHDEFDLGSRHCARHQETWMKRMKNA